MKSRLLGVVCTVLFTSITMSARAALVSRLSGQAYYDTRLDITWLADANFAQTSSFDTDGKMTWSNANAWAANLTIDGVSGWRLPNMDVSGSGVIVDCSSGNTELSELNCQDNEYGHLYYYGAGTTLGSGITDVNLGPFSNVQPSLYWSGTEFATDPIFAWAFLFSTGSQGHTAKIGSRFAWAVHDGDVGDVGVVPVPAAVWLFGSGMLCLVGLARREKA